MTPEQFIELMEESFHYKTLYHFTDASNWRSITEHGILSKQQLEVREIVPRFTGGDAESRNSDRKRGIFDHVSLSFTPQHPMAHTCRVQQRHEKQIMVSVSPAVLLLPGTFISLGLANANASEFFSVEEAIKRLDYEVWLADHGMPFAEIRDRVDTMKKVEVLVKGVVPSKYILDSWPTG